MPDRVTHDQADLPLATVDTLIGIDAWSPVERMIMDCAELVRPYAGTAPRAFGPDPATAAVLSPETLLERRRTEALETIEAVPVVRHLKDDERATVRDFIVRLVEQTKQVIEKAETGAPVLDAADAVIDHAVATQQATLEARRRHRAA